MTNNTPWRSPGDSGQESSAPAPFSAPPTPQQPPAPAYGPPSGPAVGTPPAAQQYAPPQPSPYTVPAGAPFAPPAGYAPAGWAPPPKPGLIPLRPLTLGMILGASFQVLRRNPRPTFGLSLLITGVITILGLGVIGLVTVFGLNRAFSAVGADSETIAAGAVGMTILAALVPVVLSIVGMAILQGIVALEVARGTVGEKLRLGGLWRSARGRIGALIGWSMLVVAGVAIAIAVVILLLVAVASVGGGAGIGAAVIFGVVSYLGAAVLAAWLTTRLAFVPSALMLERLTLKNAIARSWTLSTRYFWRTFGILLLVAVILSVASSVISTPLSLVASFGVTLINPNGSADAAIAFAVVIGVLTLVVSVAFGAIQAVVQTATAALLYIDLRMRKEGLDLELTRFVEARQAGDTSVENPYLVRHPDSPIFTGRVL